MPDPVSRARRMNVPSHLRPLNPYPDPSRPKHSSEIRQEFRRNPYAYPPRQKDKQVRIQEYDQLKKMIMQKLSEAEQMGRDAYQSGEESLNEAESPMAPNALERAREMGGNALQAGRDMLERAGELGEDALQAGQDMVGGMPPVDVQSIGEAVKNAITSALSDFRVDVMGQQGPEGPPPYAPPMPPVPTPQMQESLPGKAYGGLADILARNRGR